MEVDINLELLSTFCAATQRTDPCGLPPFGVTTRVLDGTLRLEILDAHSEKMKGWNYAVITHIYDWTDSSHAVGTPAGGDASCRLQEMFLKAESEISMKECEKMNLLKMRIRPESETNRVEQICTELGQSIASSIQRILLQSAEKKYINQSNINGQPQDISIPAMGGLQDLMAKCGGFAPEIFSAANKKYEIIHKLIVLGEVELLKEILKWLDPFRERRTLMCETSSSIRLHAELQTSKDTILMHRLLYHRVQDCTPILLASELGNEEILKCLLRVAEQCGTRADSLKEHRAGYTAFHYAAAKGNEGVVSILLDHAAQCGELFHVLTRRSKPEALGSDTESSHTSDSASMAIRSRHDGCYSALQIVRGYHKGTPLGARLEEKLMDTAGKQDNVLLSFFLIVCMECNVEAQVVLFYAAACVAFTFVLGRTLLIVAPVAAVITSSSGLYRSIQSYRKFRRRKRNV